MFQEVWKSYEENELTHSAAHHLMAVHDLRSRYGYARVSDIAQYLKITKGSVSSAMKHLKERGYVCEDHNKFLELSDKGAKVVAEVEAARRAFERFLTHALGMDEDDAQIDACKVEHLVSTETHRRLTHFLRFLFSEDPAAQAFLGALRAQTQEYGAVTTAEELFAAASAGGVHDRI